MTSKSAAHDTIAWAKQRLDDADAAITEIERANRELAGQARQAADAALVRLKESRSKLDGYAAQLQSEALSVKSGIDDVQQALEEEWIEVESALQAFVSAAGERADAARELAIARARAQRNSWKASYSDLRRQAEEAVDTARTEFDSAIKRLSEEAEKFQARIGEAKDAGDESWAAVKTGLSDAKSAHDRTIQKIRDAFSKLI